MIDLFHEIHNSRKQVNSALDMFISSFTKEGTTINKAMRYASLLGGKRLRPFLVYQTGRMFGIKPQYLDAPAAAIECIHAYSLIHDDLPIMDNDWFRRGLPSCHIKFGETTAILAGNALQALAFNILSEATIPDLMLEDRVKMIAILASCSGANGMCLGQALDLAAAGKRTSLTEIETIYHYKTGSLIRAAVLMGALAAGKSSYMVLDPLDSYATAIGLAFQIHDDILDVADKIQEDTGKAQGADCALSQNNYLSLLGLDKASAKAKELCCKSLACLEHVAALGHDTTILASLTSYIIERDQ